MNNYLELSLDALFSSFPLAKSAPRDLQIIANKNGLFMRIPFKFVNDNLLIRNFNLARVWKMVDRFRELSESYKTIIEFGYRKKPYFVSVPQINYLSKPKAARWQISIFCSNYLALLK